VKPNIKLGEVECGRPAPTEMLTDLRAFKRTRNELLQHEHNAKRRGFCTCQ
jgi:hypothetical protein